MPAPWPTWRPGWPCVSQANGIAIDRPAVETAALLHDIDKVLPPDDPARALPHGEGSAAWLTRHGHPELARLVANHPVTRLADEAAYRRWAGFASREERIVAYADKRAGQRLESMAARFASWDRRYPDSWDATTRATVHARAARLEADVCRAAARRARPGPPPGLVPRGSARGAGRPTARRDPPHDRAPAVPVRRRRPGGRPAHRSLRGRPGRRGRRRAARPDGRHRAAQQRRRADRAPRRAAADPGHVRWRHAGHRAQSRAR